MQRHQSPVRVDMAQLRELKKLALAMRRSISSLMREAIEYLLAKYAPATAVADAQQPKGKKVK